ncbi:hypothetical protein [Pseudonocardia kunmingensis]|uniref:Parallel beta helix pectate lyase-like protein n=1 Tax=Pseudonocardia kunmingensis TaxID=630975 RepID=A0A543DY66_9PSEU|nr:hypothetical protein [Pseudonocardia kunmingensis]TQM14282.1 hypothetical protein FB558_1044 [Pseudonocardia kunmingensis]
MSRPRGSVRAFARGGLALATCGLAVTGVLVATDGTTFPGVSAPTVALAPAVAVVECAAAGPYRIPERGSVGVPADVTLCPSGPRTVTVPGAVLDGWEVRGGIVVAAPDVVVRRSRIVGDGSTPFGIRTEGEGSVRIEDVTLTGDFPEAAIGGDHWSGERVEICGVTRDGARLGDSARLRNSSVHDFATAPGDAASALVVRGTGRDVLVEDNTVELGSGPGRDSAVLLAPEDPAEAREGPVVIRGNVLGGGRYTLRQDEPRMPSDVRITGNRFRRDAEQAPLRVSRRAVLEDNTYLDGGRLPLP